MSQSPMQTKISNLKTHRVSDDTIRILTDIIIHNRTKPIYLDLFKIFLEDFENNSKIRNFKFDEIYDKYTERKPIRCLHPRQVNKILLIMCRYNLLLTYKLPPNNIHKPFCNMPKRLRLADNKSRCFMLNQKKVFGR